MFFGRYVPKANQRLIFVKVMECVQFHFNWLNGVEKRLPSIHPPARTKRKKRTFWAGGQNLWVLKFNLIEYNNLWLWLRPWVP